jgi:hypothetical protein
MARMPGGGRFFNDDMVKLARIFAGILLVVFFLSVIRLYFDGKSGNVAPLKPTRGAGPLIQAVLDRKMKQNRNITENVHESKQL